LFDKRDTLGQAAAEHAAERLRSAIAAKGRARIVAATGAAQFSFLDALTRDRSVDWPKVEMFHLDEYVGLAADHPASFRKFLTDRLIAPTGLGTAHLLDGECHPEAVCLETGTLLRAEPVDVAFVGIGENAHLAFNDPPADFDIEQPYIVVDLDEACRRQQVGEGWFPSLADVPTQAISMSIRQILSAREIIAIVPERRKAIAVRAALEGEISPLVPASILRTHPNVTVYLDRESSELLMPDTLQRAR
jgi:glucosamine-6-phosphate deaminase